MWIYLRILFAQISKYFIQTTIVATVLFITIGLFIQWGFPNKQQKTSSVIDVSLAQEKVLYESFKTPIYQTEGGKQVAAIEKRVYCSLMGSQCTNNYTDQIKNFPNSLFGHMSTILITPLTHPPASGIAYIRSSFQDAGFITKAHAAEGIGFASLRPFLPVWKAFRNMTYIVLVILIIILGFMIMFQYKIDSHTIISVQNSLPRIAIALLVITFSYAIAGLLIDLTYVIILLIFQIFSSSGLPGMDANALQNEYLTSNILGAGALPAAVNSSKIYFTALSNIYLLIPTTFKILISAIFNLATAFVAMRLAQNGVPLLKTLFGNVTLGVGVSISVTDIAAAILAIATGHQFAPIVLLFIMGALIAIGILFLYFRILFLLIGAYIQIIINVIFAPVFLLSEVIPGQSSLAGWLKKLFGNLMVFPIVITLILTIQVIQTVGISPNEEVFSMPLLYGFDTGILAMIISGAFMFAIPDITKSLVNKIAGEPTIKAGPGLLLGGAGILAGSAMGTASQLHTLQKVSGFEGGLPGTKWLLSKFRKPPTVTLPTDGEAAAGHSDGGS